MVSLILRPLIVLLVNLRFSIDGKSSKSIVYGYYGLIVLVLIPLSVGATWYFCCCRRQIETAEIIQEVSCRREDQVQDMENNDAHYLTEISSVAVAEKIAQDQQMTSDGHITIVSSACVYQTAMILTDEEISVHSTESLCSARIVL